MNIQPFQNLKIWREAHDLTIQIYKISKSFPKEELYSLTSQLRRAASSVSANIVEGSGRNGDPEFRRFLNIARASAKEALYHCMLARDLGYIPKDEANSLVKRYDGLSAGIFAFTEKLKKAA